MKCNFETVNSIFELKITGVELLLSSRFNRQGDAESVELGLFSRKQPLTSAWYPHVL